jgi:hypothetical protein
VSLESIRDFYAQVRRDRGDPRCRDCDRLLWNYPDDVQSSPVGPQCWACFIAAWEQPLKEKTMAGKYQRSSAWTYSQLKSAENCLRYFGAMYVDRTIKYVETEPQKEGKRKHLQLRLRMAEQPIPLPADMQVYEPICVALEKQRTTGAIIHTELEVGIDPDFNACNYDALTCWQRGQIDLAVMKTNSAMLFDWKDGDPRYEDPFQLEIYAVDFMARFPHLEWVSVANIWLRTGKPGTARKFTRKDDFSRIATDMARRWDTVERAKSVGSFPAMPNNFCRGCAVLGCEFRKEKQ